MPRPPRPAAATLTFVCACDRPVTLSLAPGVEAATCAGCGRSHALRSAAAAPGTRLVRSCHLCGLDRLYVQKDFNRKAGFWIFAAAAALSVPTWGLSLLAATLVDLALHAALKDVTICYGCGAQHRGFARNPDHAAYDLHVAESVAAAPRTA